jgi:hypothetical protein
MTTSIGSLLLAVALSHAPASTDSLRADLQMTVGEEATVGARVDVYFPVSSAGDVYTLVLPFQVSPASGIKAATDVSVARLLGGPGYTVLAITAPPSVSHTQFSVTDAASLEETADGRAKLAIPLSFSLMAQAEKRFLTSRSRIHLSSIQILLPRVYDVADVVQQGGISRLPDGRTYALNIRSTDPAPVDALLAFPSPSQNAQNRAKLIFSLVLGSFAVLFQLQPFRERRRGYLSLVFVFASAILGLSAYFSLVLAKSLDFLVYAAAALPSALYALVAVAYITITRRIRGTISGQVTINGASAKFVKVRLFKLSKNSTGDTWLPAGEKQVLQEGGRYEFLVKTKKDPSTFRVAAEYRSVTTASDPHSVAAGGTVEIPVLAFQLQTTPAPALTEPRA